MKNSQEQRSQIGNTPWCQCGVGNATQWKQTEKVFVVKIQIPENYFRGTHFSTAFLM